VAKAVNNGKAQQAKGTPGGGKPAQSSGAVGKRTDAKPARGKPQPKAKTRSKSGDKKSIGTFLHEVRIELRKVTWPTRKELMQSTVVVLVAVAIMTTYTFVLDTAFSRFVELVISVIT
jgi:preprotein translocase subunit SecE